MFCGQSIQYINYKLDVENKTTVFGNRNIVYKSTYILEGSIKFSFNN